MCMWQDWRFYPPTLGLRLLQLEQYILASLVHCMSLSNCIHTYVRIWSMHMQVHKTQSCMNDCATVCISCTLLHACGATNRCHLPATIHGCILCACLQGSGAHPCTYIHTCSARMHDNQSNSCVQISSSHIHIWIDTSKNSECMLLLI